MDGGVNGSILRSDMYAEGPSNGVRNLLLSLSIGNRSCGREIGESERRVSGNEHIRHADVKMKMLYVK